MADDITFGDATEEHGLTNVRVISRDAILACPHVILAPQHYRADGSCRCDDPDHLEMHDYGYDWDDVHRQWRTPPCAICGEPLDGRGGGEAEMHSPTGPESGVVHAECGLARDWEVS